ncbi:hypothetical protein M4R22_10860 [Acidovorax sp. GBBC 3334]|uniref:hypothetical protein n=1 Tax=Acidovorax sp. GBBC 3334 TaxID=2940496 RepID=UPI0023040EF8|nr:hypothetical protein [Acidovorax sp. GBBC 3334]MDA8455261.1 hypothetical protein [Acidovorax sp. GBBC 3334]
MGDQSARGGVMTVVDERTPGLGLALPHPGNKLEVDVLRVRQALTAIDAACESLAGILAAKVDGAEMAAAIANLQASITNLGTTVNFLSNHKVGVVNGLSGVAITLLPEHIKLGPANGDSAATYTYDGGRVATVSRTVNGHAAVTTYTYDGGRVTRIQTSYRSRVRTVTLTYDGNGRVIETAATEEQE